jgi:hypothetical protein
MIEKALIAAWIYIFVVLVEMVSRSFRQRARDSRHNQVRALRRFTHGNEYSRRSRRRRTAYQPAAS